MFTGMTIEELINTVEKAERQACTPAMTAAPRPRLDAGEAFTYLYDFQTMQQMVMGAA
jgi:hypothetical protein